VCNAAHFSNLGCRDGIDQPFRLLLKYAFLYVGFDSAFMAKYSEKAYDKILKASEDACKSEANPSGIAAAASAGGGASFGVGAPAASFGFGGGGTTASFGVGNTSPSASFGIGGDTAAMPPPAPPASKGASQGFDSSFMAKYSSTAYDNILKASEEACKSEANPSGIAAAAAGGGGASFGVGAPAGGASFGVGAPFGGGGGAASFGGGGAASFGVGGGAALFGAPKSSKRKHTDEEDDSEPDNTRVRVSAVPFELIGYGTAEKRSRTHAKNCFYPRRQNSNPL